MLLTTTKTKQYDLIEDDVDVDKLNKQTDKRHDFNHNKCHACVQNDIPPYIYKCNATRKKNIQNNTTQQTNHAAGGVVAQNNQVGHAPPQFDSSERGYAPGNENKKKTQKREVKAKQAHRQRATKTKNL